MMEDYLMKNKCKILWRSFGTAIRSANKHRKASTATDLQDRYVHAVTKRLPPSQREEAGQNIRKIIKDALSAQFPGKEDHLESVASTEAVEAVLIGLGHPRDLADSYREEKKYLIGPEFFDLYLLILKIVLLAVAGGLLIAITIKVLTDPPSGFFAAANEILSTVTSGLFGAFTWVTVIFAILSRYADPELKEELLGARKSWNPSDLPEIPAKRVLIKRSEPIFGLIIHIVLFILFNYAPQVIGVISFESGSSVVVPFLNLSNLSSFTLLVNIILFIGILKEIAQLLEGKHTLRLSIGSFIAGTLAVVLTLILINNPLFWNQNFVNDLTRVFGTDFTDGLNLNQAISIAHKSIIVVILAGLVIETATDFYKSLRYGSD
jgi:hypothetical protein